MLWRMIYDFLVGVAILPLGLMLVGAGGAGFWYLQTKARSRLDMLVLLISPIQAAAGMFLMYKSYDYMLRGFGFHLTAWLS